MRTTQLGRYDQSTSTEGKVEILERRLEDGYQRIEAAIQRGEDVQHWEDFWMDLLHQYEAVGRDAEVVQ